MELFGKISLAFEHGGIWMYPILLIQIASLAVMAERVYSLFIKRKMNQKAFASQFETLIRKGKIEEAVDTAKLQSATNPVGKAIVAGGQAALNFGGRDEIQGRMDEVLLEENSKIERRTAFLTMFGNVATLLGLLGTITGMIKSFGAVSMASPAEKATILSNGISEAMNCTAYGLIVAIPALVAYAVLQNRSNQIQEDVNQGALKVFNWLSYSFDAIGTSRPNATQTRAADLSV